MSPRTRDLLVWGLFFLVVGNTVVGWVRGSIDLSLVTTSFIGLIGLLTGVKPWKRKDKDDDEAEK